MILRSILGIPKMTIFYEPDVTAYSKELLEVATKCTGLEALTGADIVISNVPENPLTQTIVNPVDNLQSHINCHSLFVQIKIGYDICSFDNLKSSIARMQKCQIPKGQAILLPIGEYWKDENSLLRVKHSKPYGNTQYNTLSTVYDMWSMRGGIVEPLPPKNIDDLLPWIKQKQKSLEKVNREGKRDIYAAAPEFISDDIWQVVEEITDYRKFLVSGLDKFGSKKAQAIFEHMNINFPEQQYSAFAAFNIMTEEKDGKPIHKIPLWGTTSRKEFRNVLGIPDGWNLGEVTYRLAFYQGWKSFGTELKRLIEKGKSVKDAYTTLMNESQNMMTDLESQIPF